MELLKHNLNGAVDSHKVRTGGHVVGMDEGRRARLQVEGKRETEEAAIGGIQVCEGDFGFPQLEGRGAGVYQSTNQIDVQAPLHTQLSRWNRKKNWEKANKRE